MSTTTRNAPCPCGSGRKYKKCCGTKPEQKKEPSLLDMLLDTEDLAQGIELDFAVDTFDPVLLELTELMLSRDPNSARGSFEVLVIRGVMRHASPELRLRLAAMLRAREPVERRQEQKLQFTARALEDLNLPAVSFGVLTRLFRQNLGTRGLDLSNALRIEEEQLDTTLLEKLRAAPLQEAPGLLEGVEDPLPYADRLLTDEDYGPEVEGLIPLLAARPSLRAVNVLSYLLCNCQKDETATALRAALAGMSELAWPALDFMVRHAERGVYERVPLYKALVEARRYDILGALLQELTRHGPWQEFLAGQEEFLAIAQLLAELDDRRTLGAVLWSWLRGDLPKEAHAALQEAWADNGWWSELEQAHAAIKAGERRLVSVAGAGASSQKRGGVSVQSWEPRPVQEGTEADYHERMGWLRPIDLPPSERETEISHAFADWIGRRLPGAERASEEFQRLERQWMWTPQERWDNLAPSAALLLERTRFPNGYSQVLRRRTLSEWCMHATMLSDELSDARRIYKGVLQVDPEHPIAKLRLEELLG